HQLGRKTEIRPQHLDRQVTLEPQIACAEHLRESAGTDPVLQLISGAKGALKLPDQIGWPDAGVPDGGDRFAGVLVEARRGGGPPHVAERRHSGEWRLTGRAGPGRMAHMARAITL